MIQADRAPHPRSQLSCETDGPCFQICIHASCTEFYGTKSPVCTTLGTNIDTYPVTLPGPSRVCSLCFLSSIAHCHFSMGDPFSILAGTASITDLCVRLTKYFQDVNAAAGRIEQDLFALLEEFIALQAVNESIRNTWLDHHKTVGPKPPENEPLLKTQWQDLDYALRGCSGSMLRLSALIEKVVGKDGYNVTGKLDGIKKVLRKQSKDKAIFEVRQQVMSHRDNLQVLLLALNLYIFHETMDWYERTNSLFEAPILEFRRARSVARSAMCLTKWLYRASSCNNK